MADRFIGNIKLYRVLMATRILMATRVSGVANANAISDIRNWPDQDGESKMAD